MHVCLSPNGMTTFQNDAPSDRLLVATIDGISDLGELSPGQWSERRRLLRGVHVGSLLVEPTRGGIFAGAHSCGLYRSLDGGESWDRLSHGLSEEHVYTLAVVERDGQPVLYAGTEPPRLFESVSYGETWLELPALRSIPNMDQWRFPPPPNVAHVKNLAFDPRDLRTILLAIEQGALLKSVDAGGSWIEIESYERPDHVAYRDVHRVLYSPTHPDTILMVNSNGFMRSDDGGATWEQTTNRQSRLGYPDGLVLSPFDEDTLFLSGAGFNPSRWHIDHTANPGVLRSRDGGRTWQSLDDALPQPRSGNFEALSLESWPGGYRLFIGTTDGEVFGSADEGDTWSRLATGLPPVSKVMHYRALHEQIASGGVVMR